MRTYFIDKALEIDEREKKLPVWAQDKLSSMRRATEEAMASLEAFAEGGEPGPFWIQDENEQRFYIHLKGGHLVYGDPAKGAEMTFYANHPQHPEGWLTVNGQRSIMSAPWVSNVLLIRGERD